MAEFEEIEFKKSNSPEKSKDYVKELNSVLYEHLSYPLRKDMIENVEQVYVGTQPPGYRRGAYKDDTIYIPSWAAYRMQVEEIASINFHEMGHALLNHRFPDVDAQKSADFLMLHATGLNYYKRDIGQYSRHREELEELLVPYKDLKEEIRQIMQDKRRNWYPELSRGFKDMLEDDDIELENIGKFMPAEVYASLKNGEILTPEDFPLSED
ncbi:MAG: hypothetical protein SVV03_06055 [Candidatus Nanohaloarchaea archaeon]|nr:hypothetical protein [Candidatus Nanohaloarchaea archaeon]